MDLPSCISSPEPDAWTRLWRYHPTDAKDDAWLERERRGARWRITQHYLLDAFDTIDGLRAIELGSGRGDLSVMLAEQGAEVTLVDASGEALDQARHRFERLGLSATYLQEDLFGPLVSCRERFDIALSSGLIEHFKGRDRTGAVRVHHQVLKPGGLSMISVPHACCIPYRVWKLYLELRGWWPYGFELPYTRGEITRRAGRAGFIGVETVSLGFWESVATHWLKGLLGYDPDWSDRPSRFDRAMGVMLLMFGRRSRRRTDALKVRC